MSYNMEGSVIEKKKIREKTLKRIHIFSKRKSKKQLIKSIVVNSNLVYHQIQYINSLILSFKFRSNIAKFFNRIEYKKPRHVISWKQLL